MVSEEQEKGEKYYIEQMGHWLEEQEIIENKIKRAIESYSKIIEINKKQLILHQERTSMGKAEFEAWKVDNGIN